MLKSILNVHGASDNYLSCSEGACPTWLDSYIYKYVNYHIAGLKHTLNTDLSPLTYTIHFIVVYTNITILTIHIILFLIRVFQRTSQTDIINTHSIKLLI